MDDAQRERIIAAKETWRTAERAYSDQAAKHWAWTMDGWPLSRTPEPLTPEAWDKLARLRNEADLALTTYRDLLDANSPPTPAARGIGLHRSGHVGTS